MNRSPALQWTMLVVGSVLLGGVLTWVGMSAALLLGPMLTAIGLGASGALIRVPRRAFTAAQGVIGCLVAHAITVAILATVLRDWPAMLLAVASTIVSAGLVSWALARWGSLPGSVAAWGLSPGAASAMIGMAEEYGSDPRIVAFMQYSRAVCVVLAASAVTLVFSGPHGAGSPAAEAAATSGQVLPFLATLVLALGGAWLGRLVRLPSGGLLGPMIVGSVLHATGLLEITLPGWFLAIAYAGIGWYVGLRFTPETIRLVIRTVPQILLATVAMIALGGVTAWFLTRVLATDFLTAYLATSPGGLDSVAIIAAGQDVDVPLIFALQTLRLFLVILTGPAIAKFVARTSAA